MYYPITLRSGKSGRSSTRSAKSEQYSPELMQRIGAGVETLVSRHNSLGIHKRAIERQLASIAAQIREQDGVLTPRDVFLLVEMRGWGGLSKQLEQIAHILREEGYWKPRERVQNYDTQSCGNHGRHVDPGRG